MINQNTAIKFQDIGKCYPIKRMKQREFLSGRLFNSDLSSGRNAHDGRESSEVIWALQDISLEIEQGDIIGLVGPNGAGKSTLLKILARVTQPTTGFAEVIGRVGSLLEVGTGFHPELTGRENIFLNGSILGLTRKEIERKYDEIVAFSGVEHLIDLPVKQYSSGQYMRLGFSVAAHLDHEILLIDEMLSVGDAEFQEKSLAKTRTLASDGRTILLVSHQLTTLLERCSRVAWLDKGRLIAVGDPATVIAQYKESVPVLA